MTRNKRKKRSPSNRISPTVLNIFALAKLSPAKKLPRAAITMSQTKGCADNNTRASDASTFNLLRHRSRLKNRINQWAIPLSRPARPLHPFLRRSNAARVCGVRAFRPYVYVCGEGKRIGAHMNVCTAGKTIGYSHTYSASCWIVDGAHRASGQTEQTV